MKDKIYTAIPIDNFKGDQEQDYVIINRVGQYYIAFMGSDGYWYSRCNGNIIFYATHVLEAVSLPSEEEIKKEVMDYSTTKITGGAITWDYVNHVKRSAFLDGMNWLRNVIFGK